MVKKDSEKLPKNGKLKKTGAAMKPRKLPVEHAPIKSVGEIPFALVEVQVLTADILEALNRIKLADLNTTDAKDISSSLKAARTVEGLIESCVHGLLIESLENLGMDRTDKKIMGQALRLFARQGHDVLSLGELQKIRWMIQVLSLDQDPAPEVQP